MSDNTYRALLKIESDFSEAWSIDWEEVTGIGSHLQEMARQCIALVALKDEFDAYEVNEYVTEMAELVMLLDEHQDDYVKVVRTPMGSWELSDAMEGEE